MRIKMTALDTLFFRDGKPFTKGEETWSDGIFPPYPSVIYGALRSSYFSQNIEEFRKLNEQDLLNTDNDPTSRLKIEEITLMVDGEMVFPVPADCLREKEKSDGIGTRITSFTSKGLSSFPCDYILKTDEKEYENTYGKYIDIRDFGKYLSNGIKTLGIFELNKLYNEAKVGIAIDYDKRTAKDSMLYRVDMKRPDNIEIVVSFSGLELEEKGLIKLGGEGKAVSYQRIEENHELSFPEIENEFVMYLSTPAIFDNGWLPSFLDTETLQGEIVSGLKVKLVSALVKRPDLIGGYDMKNNRAKPMLKAVPAGSAYFFDILEGNADLLKHIQGKSVSDVKSEEGFGIVYFGKTKKEIAK